MSIWDDFRRRVDVMCDAYTAKMNWDALKLYAKWGLTPPIVRWQPVTPKRLRRHG